MSPTAARVDPQLTQENRAAPDARDVLTAACAGPFALDPGQTTPLCFVLPEGITLATPPLHVLIWRSQAAKALERMNGMLRNTPLRPGALPTRPLATLAELYIPGLQRTEARMGTVNGDRTRELAWSNEPDPNCLLEGAQTMAGCWITDVLEVLARARSGTTALAAAVDDLRELHARGALFTVQTLPGAVYHWGAHPNGTARPDHPSSYPALADAVADMLRGHELRPGHGVMRRVIPRHTQGRTELIGEPVRGDDGTWTSPALRIRVLSLPGFSQPLVAVDLYRKCWKTGAESQPGNTTGYVLSEHAAHAFTITAGISPHSINSEYPVLARAYGLGEHTDTAHQCGESAQVLVQQRGSDNRLVTASVPEDDRTEVLRGAGALLAPLGLVPWTGVREVMPHSSAPEVVLAFTALPRGPSGQGGWAALAFRLCLRSGHVKARAASSQGGTPSSLGLTPWEPLSQTLTRLAGASPLVLKAAAQKGQYQAFIAQTVQAELAGGRAPLVTVDSTHAVALWPWLADRRIDPTHINFEQLGQRALQVAWGRAGVRLMRVRQNNAPPVAVGGPRRGTTRLLRVQGTTIPTYLACRPAPGPDAHAPCPVELSVLLTQPGDEPDQLARLVSGLISGDGNHGGPVLPTPLDLEGLMRG